ncbi:hypothetical protein BDB01DRAFT_808633 [Pilobolus umbonatus]|nr:hypothetical protein BDB01DRAFT_808633 [Pilobolus umbonatus]
MTEVFIHPTHLSTKGSHIHYSTHNDIPWKLSIMPVYSIRRRNAIVADLPESPRIPPIRYGE